VLNGPGRRRLLLLASAALAAACTVPPPDNRARRIYEAPEFGVDRFVEVAGRTIHYVEAGQGPPLVMIPGAFSTYRVWNRMLPELVGAYHVYAIDYVGTGDSDQPDGGFDYTVGAQAELVAGMVAALELKKPLLAGVSYGSSIALDVAARHPDLPSKVFCIEGGVVVAPDVLNYSGSFCVFGFTPVGDFMLWTLRCGILDRACSRTIMGSAWEHLDPQAQDQIVRIESSYLRTAASRSMYGVWRSITGDIDLRESMAHVKVPVLYLCGEASKYRAVAEANISFFREHAPTVEVVRMKDGVHDLELQFPHTVARILRDYGSDDSSLRVAALGADPLVASDDGPGAAYRTRR
jgi:pimeloyl-ACP methyl ester carboxylesterase